MFDMYEALEVVQILMLWVILYMQVTTRLVLRKHHGIGIGQK